MTVSCALRSYTAPATGRRSVRAATELSTVCTDMVACQRSWAGVVAPAEAGVVAASRAAATPPRAVTYLGTYRGMGTAPLSCGGAAAGAGGPPASPPPPPPGQ